VGTWAAAILATWMGAGAGAAQACDPELFRVTRNTNANVVVYEARLVPPGRIDGNEPLHPVWIMFAEDGHREELNLIESAMAYGVEVLQQDADGAPLVAIRALPELPIRLEMEAGCPVARTRVAGRDVVLVQVVVEASGGLFPTVNHLDLIGRVRGTGAEVRERILPPDR
jgi:hypothetical protein